MIFKLRSIYLFFFLVGNVSIGWINNTSAYVGLYRRDQAAVALSTLSQSDTYRIMTYSKRKGQLLNLKTVPEAPKSNATEKRRSSSLPKRSIEPTEEETEQEVSTTPTINKKQQSSTPSVFKSNGRKRKLSKAFQEDDSWD